MLTLYSPIWLVLAIPLFVAWRIWRHSSRFVRYTRLAALSLILLALAGLTIRLPSRNGTIVVIADRSLSMPQSSDAAQKEAIGLIQRAMGGADRLAVISFGESSAIEHSPQTGPFGGFRADLSRDASNLEEAIEKALALIPPNAPGKIFLLSDGRWTGKDPSVAAARAAARGIAIDYRSMQRSSANDLAIAEIDAPVRVSPGEAFLITAWVKSPRQKEIAYELRRGATTIAAGKMAVGIGLNRLSFRDVAGDTGAQAYTLQISRPGVADSEDPIPENNKAKVLIGIEGRKPLLLVSASPNSGLARLIGSSGMRIKTLAPADCDWSLDQLAQYSGVIIENVAAEKLTNRGMESVASWISETGAGLMMTGGKQSYGPGGYFKSPIEPLMPVSMELRQEHRKLSLAIVVALDRSGSMAVPVGGGRTKMDLANLASVQVLDMLSPMDEFGLVAVDSASHIIAELQTINEARSLRNQILKVESMGGGIFVYEALSTSAEMLLKARSGTRHIILFADAADAEEPGKYQELLAECGQAGITVSVIGLGKPSDGDAELLRDIAKRGNGQIFFTESAEELPRLFAQDTIIVARSMFLDEPVPIQFTGGLVTLTGKQFSGLESIGGYNLCYLRPRANLAAVSTDEYKSPIVASWQAGSGRVLCYLGEADGQYAGAMAGWKDAGAFFSSLARWTAGESAELPDNMLITQEVKNGISRIQLHLDPERDDRAHSINTPPRLTTLRGRAGSKPAIETADLKWSSADTLEIEIPLKSDETALSSLEIPDLPRVTLAPVTLPYSPEHLPISSEEGSATLSRLALATAGKEILDLSSIWKDLPRLPRLIELSPWLALLATTLLLIEVLERHTGLLSARQLPSFDPMVLSLPTIRAKRRSSPLSDSHPAIAPIEPPTSAETPALKIEAESTTPPSMMETLRQAQRQAKERTKR